MKFSKMQNKIYGSLVSKQYHTKCTNPLYPKFTSKKLAFILFAATFTYGTPEGTCAIFLLTRGHDLLSRSHDLVSRGNDLLCRSHDLVSRGHDLLCRYHDLK